MIHKTYKYNTNSLKKLKENLDDDEIFSNISKENSLKKKINAKSADFVTLSNFIKIQNEEFKEKNEDIKKQNSFIKNKNELFIHNIKINNEKDNYTYNLLNQNQNEKKGCNNFVLKSELNPKYNNRLNDIDKINLLYNYFGDENKELKKKIKKKYIQIIQKEQVDKKKKKNLNSKITNLNNANINNINNNLIFDKNIQNDIQQQKYFQNKYNNQIINLKNPLLLIKDQMGCRFLQKVIDFNPEIANILFLILINNIENMCIDLFGNYVIQKLMIYLNSENFEKCILIIAKNFKQISLSTYGTRVIQKLIEIISIKNNNFSNEKNQSPIFLKCFTIINSLIINDLPFIYKDNNSCHIIIKFVNEIPFPANDNMYNAIYKNFLLLCKDKHGCCVIQQCFECGINQQKNILYSLSNKYCSELICDQFGNYVIQYVVKCNVNIINQYLLNVILDNLLFLCKEKYASNVIEKFIYFNSPESKVILNKIINDDNILYNLITDQYGNYIIQRILFIIDIEKRIQVFKSIIGWIEEIKNLSFGSRLISKLCGRYKEFNIMINNIYGKILINYNQIENNNDLYVKKDLNKYFENLNIFLMNNYLIFPYYVDNKTININNNYVNNINNICNIDIPIKQKYNVNNQNLYSNTFPNNQIWDNNILKNFNKNEY